jgi:dihydroneopterin aldolase
VNVAPKLLVSVRNRAEALDALAGGADWIDLKEPRGGALGAVDLATAREAIAAVAGRAPISMAAGELRDATDESVHQLLDLVGPSHVKVGLSRRRHTNWQAPWRAVQARLSAARKHLVAVVYADAVAADAPSPDEILAAANEARRSWILWDTFNKSTGPLLDHIPPVDLRNMLAAARAAGHETVVAGRLDATHLARLPLDLVTMVAVRGAACRDSRDSAVSRERVAALRTALARHADCCTDQCVSRLPAASGDSPPRAGIS